MNALTTKRSRRQIEQHITKCAESIQKNGLEIGRDLIEIRDNELWSDEYDSWSQYLKDRATELVGRSFVQSVKFIRAAEIQNRLPSKINADLTPSHMVEIGRLAPDVGKPTGGKEKDYSQLKKQDVSRVLKAATAIADNGKPSVRDIRQAVDDELGIDRKAETAKRKAQRERDRQIDLNDYLSRIKGTSEGWEQVLRTVPVEAWDNYADQVDEAVKALESLLKFLRS